MAHRIIIDASAPEVAASDGVIALHSAPEAIKVTVEYAPSHDLTDAQVGKRVAQLLRQVRKMQAPSHAEEGEDA